MTKSVTKPGAVHWKKKNSEILAALQYKPLYNISRSEKWGKKIQAAAYNDARMVVVSKFVYLCKI
jgi:hypothetical protein